MPASPASSGVVDAGARDDAVASTARPVGGAPKAIRTSSRAGSGSGCGGGRVAPAGGVHLWTVMRYSVTYDVSS